MSPLEIGAIAVAALLILILIGMHIGVAMLTVSLVAVATIRNDLVAFRMVGSVANDALRDYLFAVVPLFVLMGLLVTQSGVGKDTFDVFERLMGRLKAGLGIATVFANAVFAAITGVSIASATVFSRVAVPEMARHGYTRKFATGVVAGSSVMGMLIPPSLLMIIYAVLTDTSIPRLYLAGIVPGVTLALLFMAVTAAVAAITSANRRKASAAVPALPKDLRISNPQRVIDTTTGLTKRDLVNHYLLAARRMLPHLAGRPLALVRAPNNAELRHVVLERIQDVPGVRGGDCRARQKPAGSSWGPVR